MFGSLGFETLLGLFLPGWGVNILGSRSRAEFIAVSISNMCIRVFEPSFYLCLYLQGRDARLAATYSIAQLMPGLRLSQRAVLVW